jgi:hypothetical protein
MKDKKISRKLKLNKETITKLEQKTVKGGATAYCSDPCPCNTSDFTEWQTCVKTCW